MNEMVTWPGWETVRLIGRGSFGAVYEIERDVLGEKEKAALKVITIPQSSSDIEELYGEGYDDKSITNTFKEYLKSIVAEYTLMRKLNGSSNVVSCDDVRYVQHDDGIGWDIFIKMELLTPLTKALGKTVTDEQAVRIGSDICKALVLCKKHNIIHRDIKPANIFVSENGDYKLGDFGIAKTVEKTSGGTKIGTYEYMAPEVYHDRPYGSTADIYSLGMVLYWVLNERRTPFLKMPPALPGNTEKELARKRRFGGEAIPTPAHGSDELKRIVLKACAFDPKDRYQSAEDMLADLDALKKPALLEKTKLPDQATEDLSVGLPEGEATAVSAPHPHQAEADDSTISSLQSTAWLKKDNATVIGDSKPQAALSETGARVFEMRKKRGQIWAALIALIAIIALVFFVSGKRNTGRASETELSASSENTVFQTAVPVEKEMEPAPDMTGESAVNAVSVPDAETEGTWDWSLADGVLTISGSGNMKNFKSEYDTPWFDEREKIQEIVIDNGITSVGDRAFSGCSELKSLIISNDVIVIGESAFANCSSLRSVELPTGVEVIGIRAFNHCSVLATATIPEGVTTIEDWAFFDCFELSSVVIPASVVTIKTAAFSNCSRLNAITVADGNKMYSSVDGVLYTVGGETLVQYPCGKQDDSFSVPGSVTTINDWAFSDCDNMKKIELPESVSSIGEWAFSYCSALQSVSLSTGISSIAAGAFAGCDHLTDVYYAGNEERWLTIIIETNNDILSEVNIHFNAK